MLFVYLNCFFYCLHCLVIDTIAAYAEEVQEYCPRGQWDLDGLNERLGSFRDEGARQCFYMVAQWLIDGGENVFLQDGNSTALSSGRLSEVLIYLKQVFPQIKRITSYGRAEDLRRLTAEQMEQLRGAVCGESDERWAEKMNAYISRYI